MSSSDSSLPKSRREMAIARIGQPTALKCWRIILYTLAVCLAGIIVPALYIHHLRGWEWLFIPASFMISNLVEYLFHRFPMHHHLPGASEVLKLHMDHHNYFNENEYTLEKFEDNAALVFPAIVLNLLTLGLVLPVGFCLWHFISLNSGLLFIMTVAVYYLLMQILHWATHHGPEYWTNRIPGIDYLRRHHYVHHHIGEMQKVNYNFILPLSDWIFRTHKMENPVKMKPDQPR